MASPGMKGSDEESWPRRRFIEMRGASVLTAAVSMQAANAGEAGTEWGWPEPYPPSSIAWLKDERMVAGSNRHSRATRTSRD
jgi:hypothetical protein